MSRSQATPTFRCRASVSSPAESGKAAIVILGLLVLGGAGAVWWLRAAPDSTPTDTNPNATKSASSGLAPEAPWFREVAKESGLDFVHTSGFDGESFWLPEIVSGGVGVFDYDADGWLDIYLVQSNELTTGKASGGGNRLYRNQGNGSFTDVTSSTGVGDESYGMGCACGDYDGDGDVDLYVTNVGPNVLYRNNGDGTFTDVSQASGANDPGFGASAAFCDYDRDGDLDLFVVNYVAWTKSVENACYGPQGVPDYCQPNNYQLPAPDTLYRNNGDGTFTDVSKAAGLRAAFGNGLGIACGDFNEDLRMDFFVANDSNANQIWIQNEAGTFENESMLMGVGLNLHGDAEAGMGAAAIDIDHDGDLDLFMTHLRAESNTLYRNDGTQFEDNSDVLGFTAASWNNTGFGLGFSDFDHDGNLDLYVANGDVCRPGNAPSPDPYMQPNQLLRFVPGKGFKEVLPRGSTTPELVHTSRGAAFGDLDNDGDTDIVVSNRDGAPYLLRNEVGSRGNWIKFRVKDRNGREALYARVGLKLGDTSAWRTADRSYSYCSSSDPRVHFGLADASRVETVTVRWNDGSRETFGPFEAGKVHELMAGKGR